MFAVVVSLALKPGMAPQFLPLIRENAAASLREEEGCMQFDVCTDADRQDEVFLYELYTDQQAFQAHLKTEHFLHFDAATVEMVATKKVRTYRQVEQ